MLDNYSVEIQKLFLEFMLWDAQLFVRVQNIFNAENFDRSLRKTAEFISEHSDKFKSLPDIKQISAVTGVQLDPLTDNKAGSDEWFMEEFESFTKRKELERAIMQSVDLLEKGDFAPVEKLIKDAVQISLTKDMGTEYFADPRNRLKALKDGNGQLSTGWSSLDKLLYGGFNRGELQIFAGGSGSGKSLVMQNLSVNWALMGLNGIYLSMELSEGLCSMRFDSMITGIPSNQIFKDIDDVELKVKMYGKKAGDLRIKYMPAGSNVNDMRAYVKELQVQTGRKIDFICVDYLDLASPAGVKVNPSDQFIKDKYVSEEFRNLAKELNVLFVTASQLNRSAVEEIEFDHSHIAGGISKINTADNVFGIFTSRAMRERGRYQIQAMKTRSSSGVGNKIDLDFDVNSLRITDSGIQDNQDQNGTRANNIMQSIKSTAKLTVTSSGAPGISVLPGGDLVDEDTGEVSKIPANIQSAKLKGLLNQIKGNNA
jgi:replicative DNA helicase